jgi:uncharacterized membrane protein YhiD involved in acid resistance
MRAVLAAGGGMHPLLPPRPLAVLVYVLLSVVALPSLAIAQTAFPPAQTSGSTVDESTLVPAWPVQVAALKSAAIRLPIAAALSTVLAFRPRRRGTPKRQTPVIHTQIILAIVGAVVMLVVGASLARAFGIVGAAGLVRYRAKVNDPKDAGVMLSTLAIGLSSGVGLFLLAAFGTVFILAVLMAVESLDSEPRQTFDLTIGGKDVGESKERIETLLRRRQIPFEVRTTSPEELCFEVKLALDAKTDSISEALTALRPDGAVEVKWEPRKEKT